MARGMSAMGALARSRARNVEQPSLHEGDEEGVEDDGKDEIRGRVWGMRKWHHAACCCILLVTASSSWRHNTCAHRPLWQLSAGTHPSLPPRPALLIAAASELQDRPANTYPSLPPSSPCLLHNPAFLTAPLLQHQESQHTRRSSLGRQSSLPAFSAPPSTYPCLPPSPPDLSHSAAASEPGVATHTPLQPRSPVLPTLPGLTTRGALHRRPCNSDRHTKQLQGPAATRHKAATGGLL